ncbi:unnamed protein product, partial [Rhizoctonia solani]
PEVVPGPPRPAELQGTLGSIATVASASADLLFKVSHRIRSSTFARVRGLRYPICQSVYERFHSPNDEDELQNMDMAEEEEVNKRHELKTKRRDYTGYNDDEFVSGKVGMKRAVLAKYDEDQSFRLVMAVQTGPKM